MKFENKGKWINQILESAQKNEAKNVFLEEDDKIYDQGQTLKGVNWKTFIIDEKELSWDHLTTPSKMEVK